MTHDSDSCPFYADPIDIGGLELLKSSASYFADADYMEELDGMSPSLEFAADRFGTANHSGGTQEIEWPAWTPDPVLKFANKHGEPPITVVQYLRESFRWGGFPGFAGYPDTAPMNDIRMLATGLEPI